MGARYVSAEKTPIDRLSEQLGNIDLVYEATGAAAISFKALGELTTNGVFIFTGVPGRKGPIQIDADRIMRRLVLDNQLVFGTVNAGPDAFAAAIDDLIHAQRRWPSAAERLITAHHAPEEVPELLTRSRFGIKPVVRFAT